LVTVTEQLVVAEPVAGFTVSISSVRAAESLDVPPFTAVRARTVWVTFAVGAVVGVIVQRPVPSAVALGAASTPSTVRVTVEPAVAVPVNAGAVTFVRPSPSAPESVAAVSAGVVGAGRLLVVADAAAVLALFQLCSRLVTA
jgi:hypothetical protein